MEEKMSHLVTIRIVKRGMDSIIINNIIAIQNNTIHYKIIMCFNDG